MYIDFFDYITIDIYILNDYEEEILADENILQS